MPSDTTCKPKAAETPADLVDLTQVAVRVSSDDDDDREVEQRSGEPAARVVSFLARSSTVRYLAVAGFVALFIFLCERFLGVAGLRDVLSSSLKDSLHQVLADSTASWRTPRP